MSSKFEQVIDEIEDYIEGCKPKFMSNSEIIVNREEIDDLLRELRRKTPDEIKHYQKIISRKEEILNDARAKADALVQATTAQTAELVSEHEIMQQAYAQANEVVSMATAQAQEILDKAIIEANNYRAGAMQYADDMLAHLDNVITSAAQSAAGHYENLLASLNHYKEIIDADRSELHPVEETDSAESLAEETGGEDSSDLDLI